MPFKHALKDQGRLLELTIWNERTVDDTGNMLETVRRYVGQCDAVLISKQEERPQSCLQEKFDFGARLGQMFAEAGVYVAVVKGLPNQNDFVAGTAAFLEGAIVAQFESRLDAKVWLQEKLRRVLSF